MTDAGSVVVRRRLGRELRTWRERARRTLDDVAAAHIASVSKVQRIERRRTAVRPGDVRELCHLYGLAHDTTETLADLAGGDVAATPKTGDPVSLRHARILPRAPADPWDSGT